MNRIFLALFGITLALGFFFLSPHSALAAGRVLTDGFESGNNNLWSQNPLGKNKCPVVIQSTSVGSVAPHTGSYAAQCNWTNLDWQDPNFYNANFFESSNYTSDVFIRFWVRYDNDVDLNTGSKLLRFGDLGGSFCDFQLEQGVSAGVICQIYAVRGGNANWLSPNCYSAATNIRQWNKFEIYIKEGVSGQAKVWLNDNLFCDRSGNTTQDESWARVNAVSNWSNEVGWEHDMNNHTYFDDWEIWTDNANEAHTGTMAGGDIAANGTDTTPPAAPTGLGVQ
ncbi:MAG: hypothetical protein IPJ68_00140 [Candidatus Moraniibacteriota bacterium]|nr:MAG: hypothetical protein IPJ68_00140 [Candidatus Moranbacteria bacterium]